MNDKNQTLIYPFELVGANSMHVFSRKALFDAMQGRLDWGFAEALFREVSAAKDPTEKMGENGDKHSYLDYHIKAWELFASMRQLGFQEVGGTQIEVTQNLSYLDGAHRVAAAISLGIKVSAVTGLKKEASSYNLADLVDTGLPRIYADYLATDFLLTIPSCRYMLLFGVTKSQLAKATSIVNKGTRKVVSANFFTNLSENGKLRSIWLSYGHHEWFTEELLHKMTIERFMGGACSLGVLVIDDKENAIVDMKSSVLTELGLNFERRVHSSDTYAESLRVLPMLSKNGRTWMNTAPINSEIRLIDELGGFLNDSNRNQRLGNIGSVSGGSILEIYGLRKGEDREAIFFEGDSWPIEFDNHHKHYRENDLNPFTSSLSPFDYFYLEGVKVLSIGAVLRYKAELASEKDSQDVRLIVGIDSSDPFEDLPGASKNTNHSRRILTFRIRASRAYEASVSKLPASIEKSVRKVLKFLFRRSS